MSEQEARDRLVDGLRQGLTRAAAESEPIDYDTLEAYVDDRLDDADREVVDTRLADDPALRAEVEELRALRAVLPAMPTAASSAPLAAGGATGTRGNVVAIDAKRAPKARTGGLFSVSPTFAVAASVFLLLGAGAAWWFRGMAPTLLSDRPIASGAASGSGARPAPRPALPAPSTAPAASETSVRDGDRVVTLAADRSVTGLDKLDPALRARVGEMLASGKLPASPSGLQTSAGQLLSAPRPGRNAAAFGVRAPVGVAVRETQPVFYWTPAPGATAYHVRIVDEALDVVAESEAVRVATWRPLGALPRGRVLQWQVEAVIPSGNVLAPVPPAPEARFRVLTEVEDAALTRALAASGDSSLAALYLYTEAGLRNDARRVIQRLLSANPRSPLLEKLYADLRQR